MLSSENTLALIPQKAPFVMIDQLITSDETGCSTIFTVKADNLFLENDILGEAALVENIAQTAAARAGYEAQKTNGPVLVGYIGAIKNLEILALPKPGDLLETSITILNQVFNVTIIKGEITCGGIPLARCEMKIFLSPN